MFLSSLFFVADFLHLFRLLVGVGVCLTLGILTMARGKDAMDSNLQHVFL